MSTDNTSGETLNNEVLADDKSAQVIAKMEKELQEAKELAAKKAEEARKANYKIEVDEKFTKTVEGLKSEFETKIKGLTTIVAEELAKKDAELGELKTIVSASKGQTTDVAAAPAEQVPEQDKARQSKYDGMFGVIR